MTPFESAVARDDGYCDGLYEAMRRRIIEGRHRPGTLLSESALARLHGTSRTPIREALSRLWEAGYVERLPGRGYLIARITISQVRDTLEIRRLLETEAVARVAKMSSDESIGRIRFCTQLSERTGAQPGTTGNNWEFHLAIVNATNNSLWIDMISRCLFHVDRFLAMLPDSKRFRQDGVADHAIILDAIERRDVQAARASMDRHLNVTSSVLLQALECGSLRGASV
jgi:DNA-binding GntR family transcriptional regulator